MSEKVTFRELIESIAEQTDHSRQFTHDFLKDFVAVINNGLESDGAINIAGFGKFKLRSMDEREGYNPQTKEKITIPARKKVVFKPYKALRELVNAPYAHLDAEFIDDEDGGNESQTEKQSLKLPAPSQPKEREQAPWEKLIDETESQPVQDDDPFGFGQPAKKDSALQPDEHEEDDDIVEFSPDAKTGQQEKKEKIAALIAERKKRKEQEADEKDNDIEKDTIDRDKEPIVDDVESAPKETSGPVDDEEGSGDSSSSREIKETSREEPQENFPPSPPRRFSRRKQKSKSGIPLYGVAAAFIILLLAAGAWYFTGTDDNNNSNLYKAITAESEPQTDNESQQLSSSSDLQTERSVTPATNRQDDAPTGSVDQAPRETQQALVITRGQTLWSLAIEQYDDPYLWPWIYGENQTSIDNPDLILAGQTLALPIPEEPNGNLSVNDSLQVAIGYVDTYHWYKNNGYEKAKYYLYAAKIYNNDVFDYTDVTIDKADLTFANRVR